MQFFTLRYQLSLSFKVRLTIAITCFLICTLLCVFCLVFLHLRGIAVIFNLPIAVAAWMFKGRGACICILCTEFILIVINSTLARDIPWPVSPFLVFTIGIAGFTTTALFVIFIRKWREVATTVQQQSQQAEQQIATAYAHHQQFHQLEEHFLNHMNHELRTPLMGIMGSIALLQQHQGQLDAETQATFLNHAARGCQDLQMLVDNILNDLQFGQNGLATCIENFSLADIVRENMDYFVPQQQQIQRLQVTIPEQLVVRANKHYVQQVLYNLLSNAFKYSPPDTAVVVSAVLVPVETQENNASRQICISVQDAGPGIRQEEIPMLFQKFARLERDLMGPVRGVGLGLYISKHLVESMGGQIWVESAGIPGKGSRFCFTLPVAGAE